MKLFWCVVLVVLLSGFVVADTCLVCNTRPRCIGEVCLHADSWCRIVECPSRPPLGFHSHSTHYEIEYSQADLDFNRSRAGVKAMLRSVWLSG